MIVSLKTRIAVWCLSLVSVILIGLGVAIYAIVSQSLMSERRDLLMQDLVRFPQLGERYRNRGMKRMLEEIEEELPVRPGDELIEVFTADGQSQVKSTGLRNQSLPFRPDLAQTGTPSFDSVAISDGTPTLLGSTKITINGQSYLVSIAVSLTHVRGVQRRLLATLLISVPVAILLGLVGGIVLARRAVQPLSAMTETAHRISANQLDQRIELERGDRELKELASAFNQMLQRLDGSFAQIRQFTADASHELRTPVAILLGETELAIDDLLDYEECKNALVSRREELQRMAQIVGDLLTLSQFDYNQNSLQIASVDFSDLVIEVCEQQRLIAKAKGVQVEFAHHSPVTIQGDATRLRQMVRNILDNAIKYTPGGGVVGVELVQAENGVELTVTDNGIGIPSTSLEHVFDRFYRVDQARTRKEAGSGLGLSIVKEIVEAHGGVINIKSFIDLGTVVSMSIPHSIKS